jgi:hypothetical protein
LEEKFQLVKYQIISELGKSFIRAALRRVHFVENGSHAFEQAAEAAF